MKHRRGKLAIAALLAALAGCREDGGHANPTDAAPETDAPAMTNRIDLPAAVRQNLGITFARAEYRRVASTLRVPGRFELPPTARHEIRAPFGGRVELLVRQYEPVQAGQTIARISSPEWHRLQLELEEDAAEIDKAGANLEIARQAYIEAETRIKLLEERLARLQSAEVRRSELESELAIARAALPRLRAEVAGKRAEHEAAKHHLPLAEQAAASQLGISREDLLAEVETPAGRKPRWQAMALVEVRASANGIVDSIAVTGGSRVDALGPILTTIDPTQLRFRAVALQSDIPRLQDGQAVSIVPPSDRGESGLPPVPGTLRILPDANAEQRTIDLIIALDRVQPWCRPGVTALAEIAWAEAEEELAIPAAAVIQDGLNSVFFRRDRKNPDVVIRTDADLGISDGRWVVVQSGLAETDEVVLDGIYELKLAGSAAGPARGGHFHADGTWHADGEKEPGAKR